MSVLVIGCGYLGLRAARAWLAAGRSVSALTRGRADVLKAEGITPIVGDVTDPASLRALPPADTVLYAVGMDRATGKSMREVYVQGLRNVVAVLLKQDPTPRPPPPGGEGEQGKDTLPPPLPPGEGAGGWGRPKLLYISSTGVYGQTDGSWVDEDSPTEPREESGKVVLEAEAALRELRPEAVVLRFAGLYGPGRVLRRASLMKGEPVPGDAERFVNLIHVDDGVRAVLAAEERAEPGDTYLIADDSPPTRRALFTRTAELIAAPPVAFAEGGEVEANRRVSNAKARALLGFAPVYASIQDGLPAAVAAG